MGRCACGEWSAVNAGEAWAGSCEEDSDGMAELWKF